MWVSRRSRAAETRSRHGVRRTDEHRARWHGEGQGEYECGSSPSGRSITNLDGRRAMTSEREALPNVKRCCQSLLTFR